MDLHPEALGWVVVDRTSNITNALNVECWILISYCEPPLLSIAVTSKTPSPIRIFMKTGPLSLHIHYRGDSTTKIAHLSFTQSLFVYQPVCCFCFCLLETHIFLLRFTCIFLFPPFSLNCVSSLKDTTQLMVGHFCVINVNLLGDMPSWPSTSNKPNPGRCECRGRLRFYLELQALRGSLGFQCLYLLYLP